MRLVLQPVSMCCRVAGVWQRGHDVPKPLVQVLGTGKSIIDGSDDEAKSASFHFLEILSLSRG